MRAQLYVVRQGWRQLIFGAGGSFVRICATVDFSDGNSSSVRNLGSATKPSRSSGTVSARTGHCSPGARQQWALSFSRPIRMSCIDPAGSGRLGARLTIELAGAVRLLVIHRSRSRPLLDPNVAPIRVVVPKNLHDARQVPTKPSLRPERAFWAPQDAGIMRIFRSR
jgi:hypothetical protein